MRKETIKTSAKREQLQEEATNGSEIFFKYNLHYCLLSINLLQISKHAINHRFRQNFCLEKGIKDSRVLMGRNPITWLH